METRICTSCGKKYVLELGFYKNGKYYAYICKKCDNKNKQDAIDTNRTEYKVHKYKTNEFGIDVCVRCGVERKAVSFINRKNSFNYLFRVDGKWIEERPKCLYNLNNKKDTQNG